MSRINIFTLPKIGSAFESGPSLREEIEAGLLGQDEATVPGDREEDRAWAFKRSVPTVVLYDEHGLRLYDKITAQAPEYYLFNDELNLLKEHGDEIARFMGFPGAKASVNASTALTGQQEEQEDRYQRQLETDHDYAPVRPWKPARWGDADVGKWNNGVNGEAGMGGGFDRGYDVVELGAGALRKTGHLLAALAAATSSTSSSEGAPITYHPLDLSHPELHRVLGEMDEAFGERLDGKVECIGLHGDYSAGLQYIREGKLASLRELYGPEKSAGYDESVKRAQEVRNLRLGSIGSTSPSPFCEREERSSLSDGSDGSRGTDSPPLLDDASPPFSPAMTSLATPQFRGTTIPPLVAGDSDVESLAGSVGSYNQRGLHFKLNAEKDIPSSIAESSEDDLAADAAASTQLSSEVEQSEGGSKTTRPMHMVFLGSSLGNFARDSAAPFLASLPLKQGDTLLLGLDGRPHPGAEGTEKVRVAYNDPAGHTKAFEEHGWEIVRRELGLEGDKGVEFVGRYNEVLGRHEAYFKSLDKQTLHLPDSGRDVTLEKDELLNIEWSYKYSTGEALDLFKSANLRVVNSWKAPTSEYRLWLLERPSVYFAAQQTADCRDKDDMAIIPADDEVEGVTGPVAKVPKSMDEPVTGQLKGVPTWGAWQEMWALWDHITLSMIPPSMLHSKPIDLRHICLFYLGHIPTFLDIHLTRLTEGKHTEPEQFKEIFERGIDPDVDDPTQIHDHSEVPVEEADWPTLDAILAFRNRVRERLYDLYVSLNDGSFACKRKAGRVLFMTYEHEAMHAETLLYMLIQSPSTKAPSACATPQWDVLAHQWQRVETNKVLDIPAGTLAIGHDDLEAEDDTFPSQHGWSDHQFGWDNEHPTLQVPVNAFRVDALPISNAEYLSYAQKQGLDFVTQPQGETAPASWIWNSQTQEWNVRTLYGPVGFHVAGKWPLQASKVELDAYAKYKGGRLPKEHELRWFWEQKEGPRPAGEMANVGFKNWHPIPPTLTNTDHAGKILHGHNGGVWEWTDTEFEAREGYVPSKIYPGYSADFYDGKHFVVIGGSYATVPCIAGRKSFRNWYQANYRFSFVGARVAYDI